MKTLEQKIKELPPVLKKEVENFVDFLLKRYKKRKKGKLNILKLKGILSYLKNKYTSVELKHEISRWRNK